MTTLSVIIITRDEGDQIRDCLASVAWADEIVVVDSGSRDDTVAICREFTDRVYETDWPGFGPQKNRALDEAGGDWVLSIDADERVTPELRSAIEQAIRQGGHDAWRMPRRSWFCGRFMRHGGWWPDHVLRLFRRGRARFSDDVVHERLLYDGPVGTLQAPLVHYSVRRLEDMLDKMNRYSSLRAQQIHAQGKPASLRKAILRGGWTFFRTYFLQLGILDGRQGFMLAVANAEGAYYRYLKAVFVADRSG